jgi:hypothetical protein
MKLQCWLFADLPIFGRDSSILPRKASFPLLKNSCVCLTYAKQWHKIWLRLTVKTTRLLIFVKLQDCMQVTSTVNQELRTRGTTIERDKPESATICARSVKQMLTPPSAFTRSRRSPFPIQGQSTSMRRDRSCCQSKNLACNAHPVCFRSSIVANKLNRNGAKLSFTLVLLINSRAARLCLLKS